ncbi:hypothetical protein SAMN05421823_112107 [Catalinimonas alkaloidigena]|uniref:Lipoprotein n=1 Tax=Catalinimonas alkaloidigena TaxID=1075417 RepID=A0A1G9SDU8_9BACT|nr:DUF6252 family protein [Catalinimonas alkaloidigena]SDM32975.1 hypothetical protein SAMN05421823_112107 [Catalinimonas alkaloidigena]
MSRFPSCIVLLSLLLFSGCDWFKKEPSPKEELPAATQEGRHSFGVLLNGEVWQPKGSSGRFGQGNLIASYQFDGTFNISAYRREGENESALSIYSDSIYSEGVYRLNNPSRQSVSYLPMDCSYDQDSTVYHEGKLTITRFDLEAKVIAGTFEFVLARPGCDTIRGTQGRFDIRLF